MNVVKVYWNSHKKCWSIKSKNNPVRHAKGLYLKNCKFVVRESGRQRVLKEKRKNVHAYVVGEIFYPFDHIEAKIVKYNPYKSPTFVNLNHEPIFKAETVYCHCDGYLLASGIN